MYLCILYREYYYYRINKKDKGEERERDYYVTIILQMDRVTLIDKFLLETNKFSLYFSASLASSFFSSPRTQYEIQRFSRNFENSFEIANDHESIRIIATKKLVEPSNSSHTHDLRVRSHTVSFTNIVSFLKRVDTINISFVRLCRDSTRLYN